MRQSCAAVRRAESGVRSAVLRSGGRRLAALACVIVLGTMTQAHAADWLLASTEPRVAPGQVFELIVVGEPVDGTWPARLPAQIELPDGGPRIALELALAGDNGAMRRRYIGQWPKEVVGLATVSLVDAPAARLILDAGAASRSPVTTAQAGDVAPLAALAPQQSSAAPVAAAPLGFHEPMYFVFGGDNPRGARFQISFRYRLFDDLGVVAESFPLARGLFFGFTQTSMWDLAAESAPFRDTSFRPSLFYNWRLSDPRAGNSVSLAAGYEHESNGRDEADSRSIDTLFMKLDGRYFLPDGRTYVGIEPKVWTYIDKDDNPDITRYRGYGQLGLRIGRDDGLMLTALLRRGTAGVGSTQLDLSYPLRQSIFSGVGAFLHLQYFNGYGQTLLEYDEARRPQIRIGVSVVR